MEAAALAADVQSPFEQLRFARQVILTESRALAQVADRLDGEFCRAVQLLLRLPGQRDRLGHGQGGAGGPEDHGHAGLDRHAQPLPASGRGGARRPGPRSSRDDLMLILSQSGETEEVVRLLPVAGRVRRADRGHHGQRRQHAGPRRRGGDRAGPAGRGLLAGAGPQHQHHGDAGGRRRVGAGRQPDAGIRPRGFRPLPSGRQPRLSS